MTRPLVVRLLADDLTGALDTAAEFARRAAPLHVFWHGAAPNALPPSAAIDSGTREKPAAQARAIVAALTPHVTGTGLAYKKVDSLMRGPTLAELAACLAAGPWSRCIFAPAFPYQRRITRAGRQLAAAADGAWTQAGPPLVEALRAEGATAQPGRLDQPIPPGISVFDADTDADLDAIVRHAQTAGPALWCGTGGLARALAQSDAAAPATLPRPILGLFGSDQPATAAQLEACAPYWTALHEIDGVLEQADLLLASIALPPNLPRDHAAQRIDRAMARLVATLPRPGTLLVAGGETLRALCIALGATSLELQGRILPGLPRSLLRGGRWDGMTVISKSGAFGPPHLLRDLLAANGFPIQGTP